MLPQIEATFGVNDSTAGLLMSIVTVPGIILAVPAGLILRKYGFRHIATIATVLAITVGVVIGVFFYRKKN